MSIQLFCSLTWGALSGHLHVLHSVRKIEIIEKNYISTTFSITQLYIVFVNLNIYISIHFFRFLRSSVNMAAWENNTTNVSENNCIGSTATTTNTNSNSNNGGASTSSTSSNLSQANQAVRNSSILHNVLR